MFRKLPFLRLAHYPPVAIASVFFVFHIVCSWGGPIGRECLASSHAYACTRQQYVIFITRFRFVDSNLVTALGTDEGAAKRNFASAIGRQKFASIAWNQDPRGTD